MPAPRHKKQSETRKQQRLIPSSSSAAEEEQQLSPRQQQRSNNNSNYVMEMMLCYCNRPYIVLVGVLFSCAFVLRRDICATNLVYQNHLLTVASSQSSQLDSIPLATTRTRKVLPYKYVPCQISEISSRSLPEETRFQPSPIDTWKCRQEILEQQQQVTTTTTTATTSSSLLVVFIDFQIKECPPHYSSSTFQLDGSVPDQSRIMGSITDRYHFQDGCGWYNASVAISGSGMDNNNNNNNNIAANVELNWTSEFRKYSNRIKDIQDAHTIKVENLHNTNDQESSEKLKAMFTQERLDYLQRYLKPIFQKQIQITLEPPPLPPSGQQQQQSAAATTATAIAAYDKTVSNVPIPQLPDCGTLPLKQWEPVGVFQDPYYNDTSLWTPQGTEKQWPFRSARCSFPARTLQQLNDVFAGIRIYAVGDSHGDNIINEVRATLCPEIANNNREVYYNHVYDCPYRNNSFVYAYRFFRGVFQQDMKHDMDAISGHLRHGNHHDNSCKRILGLGLYNVTILTIPHWLFVYETQEGLDDFILSLKSLMINCRQPQQQQPSSLASPPLNYAELMKDHIVLLQTPTARDYLPPGSGVDGSLDVHPAHSWRGIHNHRMESFVNQMKQELLPHVDGIIPAYEMTLARMKTDQTRDGVHLPFEAYRELMHVQFAAIRSAYKFKRGMDLPVMKANAPKARWFVGHLHEWPLQQ